MLGQAIPLKNTKEVPSKKHNHCNNILKQNVNNAQLALYPLSMHEQYNSDHTLKRVEYIRERSSLNISLKACITALILTGCSSTNNNTTKAPSVSNQKIVNINLSDNKGKIIYPGVNPSSFEGEFTWLANSNHDKAPFRVPKQGTYISKTGVKYEGKFNYIPTSELNPTNTGSINKTISHHGYIYVHGEERGTGTLPVFGVWKANYVNENITGKFTRVSMISHLTRTHHHTMNTFDEFTPTVAARLPISYNPQPRPPSTATRVENKIYEASNKILNELESNCQLHKGSSTCILEKELNADECELNTNNTPFKGPGFELFKEVVNKRYTNVFKNEYQLKGYTSYLNNTTKKDFRVIYITGLFLGNADWYLAIHRDVKGVSNTFCDNTRIKVTYTLFPTQGLNKKVFTGKGSVYHPSLNLSTKIDYYKPVLLAHQESMIALFQKEMSKYDLEVAQERKEAIIKKEEASRRKNRSSGSSIFGDILSVLAQTAVQMNHQSTTPSIDEQIRQNNEFLRKAVTQGKANKQREQQQARRKQAEKEQASTELAYQEKVQRDRARRDQVRNEQARQEQIRKETQKREALVRKEQDIADKKLNPKSYQAKRNVEVKRSGEVLTWKNKAGYWFACGPVQCTSAGNKTEKEALGFVVSDSRHKYYFHSGNAHTGPGICNTYIVKGLESFDNSKEKVTRLAKCKWF